MTGSCHFLGNDRIGVLAKASTMVFQMTEFSNFKCLQTKCVVLSELLFCYEKVTGGCLSWYEETISYELFYINYGDMQVEDTCALILKSKTKQICFSSDAQL